MAIGVSPEWPENYNGSNSSSPQNMSGYLNPNLLFSTNLKHDGYTTAVKWNRATNVYEEFDLTNLTNWLDQPFFDLADGHYSYGVGVDKLERMYIAGNHHDGVDTVTTTHQIRCFNTAAFTNLLSWEIVDTSQMDACASAFDFGVYTYHHFERFSDGRLIQFLSQSENDVNAQGRDYLSFIIDDATDEWEPMFGSGHFATTENGPADEADRVYVVSIYVEKDGVSAGVDKLWVLYVWRTDNIDAASQQAPGLVWCSSADITVWKNVSGTTVTMPRTWANRATSEVDATFCESTRNSLTVDPATGFPEFVLGDGLTADYKRWTWDGAAWTGTVLTANAGERREWYQKGIRHRRTATTNRISITPEGGTAFRFGGSTRTSGVSGFSVNPCPVWLRELDIYAANVPINDTPKIYTYGDGPKMQ